MNNLADRAGHDLALIREKGPLVHNITNYVVMDFTANVLLSMGAAPVMAHAEEEVEEMVELAGSLVLNIGTLSNSWIKSMHRAGRRAAELGKPVILDPVGSGATRLRTEAACSLIERVGVSVIRGNASEVLSLERGGSTTRGVDSVHGVDDAAEAASRLAARLGVTLAITGPVDLVTNGERTVRIQNGHPLMGRITGTGCAATAVSAAFLAVDTDTVSAVSSALGFMGLAGERAGVDATAPGSFRTAFIDALYTLDPGDLSGGFRFKEG